MTKYLMTLFIIISAVLSSGQNWCWERNDELLNPYNIHTKGMNTPFTGDFDDDGDIDLIVGCRGGVLQYYENIGNADSAIWQMDEDYFDGIELDTSYAPQPSLVDLDGDGLDELYLSFSHNEYCEPQSRLDKYLNTGNHENPVWQIDEFIFDEPGYAYYCHEFIDLDYDGDYDLLFSGNIHRPFYYENTGNSNEYNFTLNNTIFDSLEYDSCSEYAVYYLADVNHDDRCELFIINGFFDWDITEVYEFINTGNNELPIWEEIPFGYFSKYCVNFTFADIDNDSDKDAIIGNWMVPLYYNENIGTPDTLVFASSENGQWYSQINIDLCGNIAFTDYDNDGDFDFIYFAYLRSIWDDYCYLGSATNEGTILIPHMDNTNTFFSSYYGLGGFRFSSGDLNGDNYPELVGSWPRFMYYINEPGIGYNYNQTQSLGIEDTCYKYAPELADLNSDGLNDIIYRNNSCQWLAYQNIGTSTEPVFSPNQLWLDDIEINIKSFRGANLNFDDRIDMIGLDLEDKLCGFINTGSGDNVSFVYIPQIFENWQDSSIGCYDCVDIDGDNDDDIIINANYLITVIENKTTTDIDETPQPLPEQFTLIQNYPNPFNGATTISFTLDKQCEVELIIYDILGREVDKLIEADMPAGSHSVIWQADSDQASGVYFYSLKTGDETCTKQMVYIK